MDSERRIERLSRRVLWLDRYRRLSSLAIAAVLVPLFIHAMASWLPEGWPTAHLYAASIALAACTWYGVEVCLVGLTALWETEVAELERVDGLPRARVVARGGWRRR